LLPLNEVITDGRTIAIYIEAENGTRSAMSVSMRRYFAKRLKGLLSFF
jgi:hypothetical protein